MVRFRIAGIPDTVAGTVRTSLASPQYGHPAHVELAAGYGPCRSCLRTFREGDEERVLFTYQPFSDPDALPAPGPVFLHREPCARYEGAGLPEDLRRLPLAVESYGGGGGVLGQERVRDRPVETVLERMLSEPGVRYAHLRNAEAGCFIARVDRLPAGG
jgi:hypothetical protein